MYSHLDGNALADSDSNSGRLSEGLVDGGEEDLDEEDVTFIPLTWPRLQPGELYNGTEEAWQGFRKYAKDFKRLDALKGECTSTLRRVWEIDSWTDELQNIVCTRVSRHPHFRRLLGERVRLTKSWLSIQFPYRAPPHYETLGYVNLL